MPSHKFTPHDRLTLAVLRITGIKDPEQKMAEARKLLASEDPEAVAKAFHSLQKKHVIALRPGEEIKSPSIVPEMCP